MAEKSTLLAIFAHPDDESIFAGGTLARYAAEGWRVALLCATRGEWGPISDETLADYGNLGEVRERELRAAGGELGVSWLRFLDLEDGTVGSIAGTEAEPLVLEKMVRAIRELRPEVVITFGPDGVYGHPDHVAVGQLTVKACGLAADARSHSHLKAENLAPHCVHELYFATFPQGYIADLFTQVSAAGVKADLWGIPAEQFGVPEEEITHTLDITAYLPRKLAAIRCHRTQLDEQNLLRLAPEDVAARYFNREFLVSHRKSLPSVTSSLKTERYF